MVDTWERSGRKRHDQLEAGFCFGLAALGSVRVVCGGGAFARFKGSLTLFHVPRIPSARLGNFSQPVVHLLCLGTAAASAQAHPHPSFPPRFLAQFSPSTGPNLLVPSRRPLLRCPIPATTSAIVHSWSGILKLVSDSPVDASHDTRSTTASFAVENTHKVNIT